MIQRRRAGVGSRRILGVAVGAIGVMFAAPAVASAVGPAIRTPLAAKPFFDSRTTDRASVSRPPGVSARERSARNRLRDRLGPQGVVQVDPLTGTARTVQRLDGTLTGVAAGDRAAVARRWLRDNRAALGLTAPDVAALTLADRTVSRATGITHLRFRQSYRGIPAFDGGVRVNLDRGGRILNVTGAPISGLHVASITPRLDAAEAARALRRDVGGSGAAHDARLVLFGDARLAWHLHFRAGSRAYYDAVVDAATGRILFRQNLVKSDVPATVFPDYPRPSATPTQSVVDIEPWLTAADRLEGRWVHAYADTDDDGFSSGDDVAPLAPGDFQYPFHPFQRPDDSWRNACDHAFPSQAGRPDPIVPQATCAWNPAVPASWQDNREQNAVQAFYLANTFREHLAGPMIGFNGFEDADKLQLETDDGAETGPDNAHLNDANMLTLPEGQSPTMQMYLFEYDKDGTESNLRNVNGGDVAAVVWHEFTHGLSNRLVVDGHGDGALGSPHAGAMGEGWSDWYALDFIHRHDLDTDSADPDVDLGAYTDAEFGSLRSEPIDCPASVASVPRCPGSDFAGEGGYTLGDFGKVLGVPEVHADGEIWAQTLWDLRTKLIGAGPEDVGSDLAEEIITEGLRLSPPQPSFLDARNAILAAVNDIAPARRGEVWDVFAHRGMGFYAGAADSSDLTPIEDFHTPPPPGPTGRVAGTVTSADSGLPIANVSVGFGGLTTDSAFPDYVAPTRTAANGTYSLTAPPGPYAGLVYRGSAGFDRVSVPTTVTAGATRTQNVALRRDWAAFAGGADVLKDASRYDDTGAAFDCGLDQLIDQTQGLGWSPWNPASVNRPPGTPGTAPTAVVRLPQTVDVAQFGLDPGSTCGDDASSTTKGFRIETSPDGAHFNIALQGTFAPSAAGRLNLIKPTANASGVRYVRLTLLSPQGPGVAGNSWQNFIDFSEIEVFGGPRNVLPSGVLRVSSTRVNPGDVVTFGASFGDPDSKITGYDWDFDGNGTVDRSTTAPATTFAYGASGDYGARVSVRDFRGGAGAATQPVHVTSAPKLGTLPGRGTKGRARFRVTCELPCTVTARLKRGSRRVGSLKRTLGAGSSTRLTISLTRKAKKALARQHRKSVKATLSVTVSYADGRRKAAHRKITIKL
jgi:extracellular elastinolytic metalloproteinase